jgi:hypothetical protein
MVVWIPPPTFIENLLSFIGSGIGLAFLSSIILTIVAIGAFISIRISQKKRLEEAYTAYSIPSVRVDYSTNFAKTELPSAPDLSILESQIYNYKSDTELPILSAEIPIMDIPSKKVREEDFVELVEIPSKIIEE